MNYLDFGTIIIINAILCAAFWALKPTPTLDPLWRRILALEDKLKVFQLSVIKKHDCLCNPQTEVAKKKGRPKGKGNTKKMTIQEYNDE